MNVDRLADLSPGGVTTVAGWRLVARRYLTVIGLLWSVYAGLDLIWVWQSAPWVVQVALAFLLIVTAPPIIAGRLIAGATRSRGAGTASTAAVTLLWLTLIAIGGPVLGIGEVHSDLASAQGIATAFVYATLESAVGWWAMRPIG
jgi:hypothetical protein